jgi:hypothetical protein
MKKIDITPLNPSPGLLACYSSNASFEDFWRGCARGDQLLWMAAQLGVDSMLLTKAAAMCANTVRHLMEDSRSAGAVDAALRYGSGEAEIGEPLSHSRAAHAAYLEAATDAHADYADHVTRAARAATRAAAHAALAAHAANATAYAEDADAYAAATDAAAYAAKAAAYAAKSADDAYAEAEAASRLQTANICREVLTEAVLEKVGQPQGEEKNVLTAKKNEP